jgi:hypothetical protein
MEKVMIAGAAKTMSETKIATVDTTMTSRWIQRQRQLPTTAI